MFKAKIEEVSKVMSLRSTILSEYFYTLMTNHNIKSIRNGMKVLIFYCFCEVVASHMSERGVLFRPILALVSFCIYFLIYVSTVKVNKTATMTRCSAIMVILSITYTVLLGTDTREVMEIHYSLSILIILMMYTLFRLKFLITIMMSILYILIFVSLGNYRMKYIDQINVNELNESHLEAIRTFKTEIQDKDYFISGQCILFLLMYTTGLYLRFFNSIRRKSAFLKVAQNAEAKMKMNSAIQVQTYWIEAIMPSSVKDHFFRKIRDTDMFSFVYCQNFENVSILFADIVGFTAMSSNKTAAQLVYLLNDLYNRFDEHGKVTNCEKIGTLGDCYYCVSGCPIPRIDHAVSCVEMGLGMCRLILKFNRDHRENVNMRVGIHSGRVIAAIIGNHRFRFDVFSNDVIIANSLESSGQPGKVHISEDTYLLVRHAYLFEAGDILLIKKEEVHGIGGMMQKTVPIHTYFVIPDAKKLKRRHSKNKETKDKNVSNKRLEMSQDTRHLLFNKQLSSSNFKRKDEKMKEDLEIVRMLQQDPDRTVEFFKNPPIHPFTQTFKDKEIEYQYLFHTTDQVEKLEIDSLKMALFIDTIASLVYTSIILLAAVVMIPDNVKFQFYSPIIYFSGYLFAFIVAYISFLYKSEISNPIARVFYSFWSHPISRLYISVYVSSLPSLLVLSFYQSNMIHNHYQYTAAYLTLTLFGLIGNCISTASVMLIKYVTTAIFTFLPIILIIYEPISLIEEYAVSVFNCTGYMNSKTNIHKLRMKSNFGFQLVHLCLLIYYLTRENEKTTRINFFATREAEIRNAEAIRAKKIAESLLYNIIPKQVFAEIVGNKWNNKKEMNFSYAHAFPNAGVIFACISNFFSSYYREDYKGGEVALRVLHTIICTFDNLLHKPVYSKLEKIKTINDCYMLASGLNSDSNDYYSNDHLIKLMSFALDMHHQLHLFNEQNIVGNTFYLKIGYNFGPVTAGIIGTTKPLYDIWGDTVNVASRMYSTSPCGGTIQVPDYVVSKLKRYFEFKYRGVVFVKGKGDMVTYLVVRSFEKPFLLKEHFS